MAIISFFVLAIVLGFPFSWGKTKGGEVVVWVGFEMLLRENSLGISEARAAWFVRWARELVRKGVVDTGAMEGGLGRLVYISGALVHESPFLAPLYGFLAMHPRGVYVTFILSYLADAIESSRHHCCNTNLVDDELARKVDAADSKKVSSGFG